MVGFIAASVIAAILIKAGVSIQIDEFRLSFNAHLALNTPDTPPFIYTTEVQTMFPHNMHVYEDEGTYLSLLSDKYDDAITWRDAEGPFDWDLLGLVNGYRHALNFIYGLFDSAVITEWLNANLKTFIVPGVMKIKIFDDNDELLNFRVDEDATAIEIAPMGIFKDTVFFGDFGDDSHTDNAVIGYLAIRKHNRLEEIGIPLNNVQFYDKTDGQYKDGDAFTPNKKLTVETATDVYIFCVFVTWFFQFCSSIGLINTVNAIITRLSTASVVKSSEERIKDKVNVESDEIMAKLNTFYRGSYR